MAAIHGIEADSFSDPWSSAQLAGSLKAGCLFLLGERDRTIVGYVIAHHAAADAEILNLAVTPAARRVGIGRTLVRAALTHLAGLGVANVFLEVRASNDAALRLYAGAGFTPVGRRAGYYRRPTEDAMVLRAAISTEKGDA